MLRTHGANQLASNSLAEAIATAAWVTTSVAGTCAGWQRPRLPPIAPLRPDASTIRRVVSATLGITRKALREAVAILLPIAIGDTAAADPALVALLITIAALKRQESRGSHHRTDYRGRDAAALPSRLTLCTAFESAVALNWLARTELLMTSLAPLPQVILEPLVRNASWKIWAGLATSPAMQSSLPIAKPRLRLPPGRPALWPGCIWQALLSCRSTPRSRCRYGAGCKRSGGRSNHRDRHWAGRGLLAAERTAFNFLCYLSGIAMAMAALVKAVRGHKARIVCTRKTTPGLCAYGKYAVRAGGGANHRFALDDAVLIKNSHVAIAGDIRTAIERARSDVGHMVKIEADTLNQLDLTLEAGVDAVLLDNMSLEELARLWRWSAIAQSPKSRDE